MPKILLINDIHYSDKPPASRTETYLEDILAKIDDCRAIAAKQFCDFTVLTGDIFHHPRANAVSHSLVSRVIVAFKDWPTPIFAIAGNHDLPEVGISAIARQPIFTLQESGVLKLFHDQGIWLDNSTYAMFFSYDNNDIEKYTRRRPKNCRQFLLFCHDMLVPLGNYAFKYLSLEDIAQSVDYDTICYGHVHWDLGVRNINHTAFVSAGSLSRVARTEENMRRAMRIAVLDVVNGKCNVSFFPLPSARPANEIFVAPQEQRKTQQLFSDYIRDITSMNIESIDVRQHINALNLEDDIRQKLEYYIFEEA